MENRFLRGLNWVLERALVLLGVLISAIVFTQVVFRYLLKQPIFWSEELPRYLLIWSTFLAAALVQKDMGHMNITLVVCRMPIKVQKGIRIITNIIILGFLGILVYSGSVVANITLYHRSTALQIPMAAVYLALPVGGILMMVYLFQQIYKGVTGRTK